MKKVLCSTLPILTIALLVAMVSGAAFAQGTGEDAAEFLIAGASAVEVGTVNFWDPAAPCRIARELADFMKREKIENIKDLVGTLQL